MIDPKKICVHVKVTMHYSTLISISAHISLLKETVNFLSQGEKSTFNLGCG